jgi:hypothetical protein
MEMEYSEQTRWNMQYRLMEKQRSMKAYCPEIPQVNMTSVHDTNEQWDIINNAPNEYRSAIARRSIAYIWQDGKLVPSCEGSIFCLSDCITKEQWDLIHKAVDNFEVGKPIESLGFTCLFDSDIKAQLKEFINTRRPYTDLIHNDFQYHGLPLTAMADAKEIVKSNGPLLICSDSIRTAELKDYLEKTDRLLVLAGHKDALSRKANATFKCGDFMVKVYNSKGNVNKEYGGYKKVSLYFDDPVACFYPENPRHNTINERLYRDVIAGRYELIKSDRWEDDPINKKIYVKDMEIFDKVVPLFVSMSKLYEPCDIREIFEFCRNKNGTFNFAAITRMRTLINMVYNNKVKRLDLPIQRFMEKTYEFAEQETCKRFDIDKFVNKFAFEYMKAESPDSKTAIFLSEIVAEQVKKSFMTLFKCLVNVSKPDKKGMVKMNKIELMWTTREEKETEIYKNKNVYILAEFLEHVQINKTIIEEDNG